MDLDKRTARSKSSVLVVALHNIVVKRPGDWEVATRFDDQVVLAASFEVALAATLLASFSWVDSDLKHKLQLVDRLYFVPREDFLVHRVRHQYGPWLVYAFYYLHCRCRLCIDECD
jgi:predicted HAD superfamily hydrolase